MKVGSSRCEGSRIQRLLSLTVVLAVAATGCVDDGNSTSNPSTTVRSSSTSTAPVGERCVNEAIEQSPDEAVGQADLAAWLIERQLPPPLRTAGLQSNATTILLDGKPVGDVTTVRLNDGTFVVTGYSFCVPVDIELATIDLAATLGGRWLLTDSSPDLGLPDDEQVLLTLSADRAVGRAICNEYGGWVAAGPEGTWRMSELFFTEMGCDASEFAYFERLGNTNAWRLDGSELVLESPGGSLRYASD